MIVIVQGESVMRARALHLRFQVDALSDDVDTAKMRLASEMKVCSNVVSYLNTECSTVFNPSSYSTRI